MTEFDEERVMRYIFEPFSLDDKCGETLFEHLEDSACILAERLMACRTNKTRSLYRGLARQYFNVAKGYATAFETLSNDPVISWCIENRTSRPDKIEALRKKKENLRETIQTLENTLPKKTNNIPLEKVRLGAKLRRSRRKQLKSEAQDILEEAASFVASTKLES